MEVAYYSGTAFKKQTGVNIFINPLLEGICKMNYTEQSNYIISQLRARL
jgi:hypothetical protein